MFKLLTLLFVTVLPLEINLPNLIKSTSQEIHAPLLNVTVGSEFSFPLSSLDSSLNPPSIVAFEISFEQIPPSGSPSQPNDNSNQIPYAQLPFTCQQYPAKADLKIQKSLVQSAYINEAASASWHSKQYLHLPLRSLLYILETPTSEIKAYSYSNANLEFITVYKFPEQMHSELHDNQPCMATNTLQDTIYIFSSVGIWQIKAKTILANVKRIEAISGFNSESYSGVDKVLHGQSGIMIGLKKMKAVFVIPEQSSHHISYTELHKYNTIALTPLDVELVGPLLYVLDYAKGLFMFKIMGAGDIQEVASLEFETFKGINRFKVDGHTIFLFQTDNQGSKVMEINYIEETKLFVFVRFFKEEEFINWFATTPISSQANSKMLIYITNYEDISLYPFNIDPRTISKTFNGVKTRFIGVQQVFHINLDWFLIISVDRILYARIVVSKPGLKCLTRRAQGGEIKAAGPYFKIIVISNVSWCQAEGKAQLKKQFNEYCELKTVHYIKVNDPEAGQLRKDLLILAVVGVLLLFVGGLFCLIQWRNNKLIVLSRLKDEIIRFRNKHRKMQPFTEEHVEDRTIQLQVPQIMD